jgi:TadE-like protein
MNSIQALLGRCRSFRRLGNSRGANLVEAAIVTPLLLLLTLGIVDFSAMFYGYLALEHGVSQATRYAITGQAETGLSRVESIKKQMRDACPTLTIPDSAFQFSFMPASGGSWSSGTGGAGDIGRVQVSYTWGFMTPLVRPFFTNGQIVLTVQSTMKNEAVFN